MCFVKNVKCTLAKLTAMDLIMIKLKICSSDILVPLARLFPEESASRDECLQQRSNITILFPRFRPCTNFPVQESQTQLGGITCVLLFTTFFCWVIIPSLSQSGQ